VAERNCARPNLTRDSSSLASIGESMRLPFRDLNPRILRGITHANQING